VSPSKPYQTTWASMLFQYVSTGSWPQSTLIERRSIIA
jgi:hypothetical protein